MLVGGMAWLITSFIIQTGAKNDTWDDRGDGFAAWVGAVCGAGVLLFTQFIIMPYLRKRIHAQEEAGTLARTVAPMANPANRAPSLTSPSFKDKEGLADGQDGQDGQGGQDPEAPGLDNSSADVSAEHHLTLAEEHKLRWAAKDKPWNEKTWKEKLEFNPVSNLILHVRRWLGKDRLPNFQPAVTTNPTCARTRVPTPIRCTADPPPTKTTSPCPQNVRQDIHSVAESDETVRAVWANAEVFDMKTEALFRYLQVFSACVMSFTHGAWSRLRQSEAFRNGPPPHASPKYPSRSASCCLHGRQPAASPVISPPPHPPSPPSHLGRCERCVQCHGSVLRHLRHLVLG